ncbi:MAG: carbamoyltransferase HypF [Bacteroidales bacterium]|nr:carbamoyltransferase HypF [Bacteroidales bacterium]
MNSAALKIHIKGLVQGVGFRPFIYRLANRFNLKGSVENRNDGVIIFVEGLKNNVDNFLNSIKNEAPPASNINSIASESCSVNNFDEFKIIKSTNKSEEITEISPDIAVCEDCLKDMESQSHRIDYPFINCTNCGPRFTIIQDLPYDRKNTTMKSFPMCEKCRSEYEDVLDRRFHAQPVACNDCGPIYTLTYKNNEITDLKEILNISAKLIEQGKIVAIKGLGGFHLACDAQNEEAVNRLRKAKNRDGKPFAVMFATIEDLKEFTNANDTEIESLLSWKRPILILQEKKKLAKSVSVGFKTLGAMLPYMPFHYLLFEALRLPVIVLTSGNISDEPIIIDNQIAIEELLPVSDAIITYNRDIYNRTDDSLTVVFNNKERLLRRSRGFAPSPVNLNLNVDGILATGAELVNCFCLGKGKQAFLSQHIGDLKNMETLEYYSETIDKFQKLFRIKTSLVVCDLHPDYLSTKYANELNIKTIAVQHHHAHIASCMAEYGLDEKVIGVAFDGIGLGTDNKIWGGEFFICDLFDFERYSHFEYIPMPGGDKATKEPWRMAISYLYKYYGKSFLDLKLPFLENIEEDKIELIISAIEKKINCPETSSAGRLFDSIAALINLCLNSNFHAEAPMRLEAIIDKNCSDEYDLITNNEISVKEIIKGVVDDIINLKSQSEISTKFHNTIISIIFAQVLEISKKYKINKVVLSGGSFQNRYIIERIENLLIKNSFKVYAPCKIPANDGGIALGQLAIAAKRREKDVFKYSGKN